MIAALGWVGSGLVVMSLTQGDIRRLRQVNLAASAVLGVFNIALGISSMIVLNAVLAGVNGYHLIRRRRDDQSTDQPATRARDTDTTSTTSTTSTVSAGRAHIDAERRLVAAGVTRIHSPLRI